MHAAGVVEHLGRVDAVRDEFGARSLDVGDDQVQALGEAGRRRGDVPAEDDRAPGARRRELDYAVAVTVGIVGVEPPPEPAVELLRAVDIRDGDDEPPRTSCRLSPLPRRYYELRWCSFRPPRLSYFLCRVLASVLCLETGLPESGHLAKAADQERRWSAPLK